VFNTGYFERVWIVQEIVLGKSNTYQIGNVLFSVAVLAAAVQMLTYYIYDPASKIPKLEDEFTKHDIRHLKEILRRYLEPALHKHWTLDTHLDRIRDLNIVMDSRKRFCSDDRDHIYGLVSLFEAPDVYDVDYALSLKEVFADFTVHCMLNGQGLHVLNFSRSNILIPRLGTSDLPSWCPNWMGRHYGSNLLDIRQDCSWRASGGHELVHLRPSKVALALKGLIITRLRQCSFPISTGWRKSSDGKLTSITWLEDNKSLCAFFRSLGMHIDHSTKLLILRIFEHILIPTASRRFAALWNMRISPRLSALFEQNDPRCLMHDLLVPVYIAIADPELFEAAGFEIDMRVSSHDFAEIESLVNTELQETSRRARLFATENNLLGLTVSHSRAQKRDLVCVLYGSDVPEILRPVNDEGHYILMGACNVDGLMFGEGLEMGLEEQDFILI
jgi:hypothetical protein